MPITIIDRVQAGVVWVELPWLTYLIGSDQMTTLKDPTGEVIVPNSVIVMQRPDLLTDSQLDQIRATPHVGLYHISDEWYRLRLDAYDAFAFVWRQHAHSSLHADHVRALPLGPAAIDRLSVDPGHVVCRAAERRHLVSFSGKLITTRFAAVKAVRSIESSVVHVSGRFNDPGRQISHGEYMELLEQSVFVVCPMGNVHLESFRVYEALEAGAIPIVETRRRLDYFSLLLGEHPLPTVRNWRELPRLLSDISTQRDLDEMQVEVALWWADHKAELQQAIRADLDIDDRGCRPDTNLRVPRLGELMKHQNATSLFRRGQVTAHRLRRRFTARRRRVTR